MLRTPRQRPAVQKWLHMDSAHESAFCRRTVDPQIAKVAAEMLLTHAASSFAKFQRASAKFMADAVYPWMCLCEREYQVLTSTWRSLDGLGYVFKSGGVPYVYYFDKVDVSRLVVSRSYLQT